MCRVHPKQVEVEVEGSSSFGASLFE